MAAIRCKGTKSELALRKALREQGIRFRTHSKVLPGRPDFVIRGSKVVVFCDGDFWHGRNWEERKARAIKVRRDYWIKKIEGNMARDKRVSGSLRRLGWKVLRYWETDILRDPERVAKRIKLALMKAG